MHTQRLKCKSFLCSKNLLYNFAGPVLASRGDRIRCTVMFENEKKRDGKKQVPVSLCLNGRKIITKEGEDQFLVDCDRPLYPYICMTDGCSVLAKVRIKNGPQGLTRLPESELSASDEPRWRAQK